MAFPKSNYVTLVLVRTLGVVFICLLLGAGCMDAQVKYLPSDEKVYCVPKDTLIDRGGSVLMAPWDGYLISDGLLLKLYKAAKQELEKEKIE